jgi:hypothetical protein
VIGNWEGATAGGTDQRRRPLLSRRNKPSDPAISTLPRAAKTLIVSEVLDDGIAKTEQPYGSLSGNETASSGVRQGAEAVSRRFSQKNAIPGFG